MGTIAEKLTYLNGTKQALKESINNLGGNIDNDTTFRQYAQELQDIYDNIPKTTDTGTNLSLNTIKGKMNLELKGDTSQNGTPTPDTPIDIEVVTGTQEVKVENKNLFKFKQAKEGTAGGVTIKCNDNTTLTLNGTSSGQVAWGCELEPLKLVGTYKASGYTRNDNFVDLYWKDKNGTIQFAHLKNNPTITFNEGDTLYQIFVYVANGVVVSFNNETFNLQLEKGSTATTYIEHQEQTQTISLGDIELCKIGNYQDYLYKSGDKWYKKEQIYKYKFTGNETYSTWTSNRVTIAIPADYQKVANSAIPLLLCTHYKPVSRADIISYNKSITFYSSSDTLMGTIVNDSDHNTAELLKTFMTNNNVYMYYVLATANDIEITNTTLIEQLNNLEKMYSYNGVTNISTSGNLPIVLGVSALKGE